MVASLTAKSAKITSLENYHVYGILSVISPCHFNAPFEVLGRSCNDIKDQKTHWVFVETLSHSQLVYCMSQHE